MTTAGKIKVLYVLSSPDKYGGASKSFVTMLSGMLPGNIEPYIVINGNYGLTGYFRENDIPYKVINYRLSIYPPVKTVKDFVIFVPRLFKTLLMNCRAERKISDYAREVGPDIIHTNVGPLDLGYKVAKRLGVPHIWHIREYQDLDFGMHFIPSKRRFIEMNRKPWNYPVVITNELMEYFGLDRAKNSPVLYNEVLHDGVLPANETMFTPDKEKYFLFAGRLQKTKGIETLINSFAAFAQTDAEYSLYVAGDTDILRYKKYVIDMVRKAGLEDRVVFLGMRDDVYDLMSKAYAVVVPSVSEGFGRVTVEAIFNGALVIGNDSAGTRSILKPEGLGLLYSTPEELTGLMKEVASKGVEAYFPLINKAQKRCGELYSCEQNSEKMLKIYKKIVK